MGSLAGPPPHTTAGGASDGGGGLPFSQQSLSGYEKQRGEMGFRDSGSKMLKDVFSCLGE